MNVNENKGASPKYGNFTMPKGQSKSRKLRRKRLVEVKKIGNKEEVRKVRELCYSTGQSVHQYHTQVTNENKNK